MIDATHDLPIRRQAELLEHFSLERLLPAPKPASERPTWP
jgi:hypothetical protein